MILLIENEIDNSDTDLSSPGSPLSFQNVAERTVVLTVLFLQVVTLAFYTSNLVSALTVGPSLPPYKDLQDIDQEASLTFGFLKGSSNANDFRVWVIWTVQILLMYIYL